MVWFSLANGLNRRRKTQQLRADAMASVQAPQANHPGLGLGGRSIELSIAAGHEIDPQAVELAARELHSHIQSNDLPPQELLADAQWLSSFSEVDGVASSVRLQLQTDLRALAR